MSVFTTNDQPEDEQGEEEEEGELMGQGNLLALLRQQSIGQQLTIIL